MDRRSRIAGLVAAACVLGALGVLAPSVATAQAPSSSASSASSAAPPPQPSGQGVAVLAIGPSVGPARDEAFALARAIYGSRLRPTALDEIRARVLAGDPPPPNALRDLKELAEIRAGLTGAEDAASRRLLAGIAKQVGAEALLVVKAERAPAPIGPAPADAADGGAVTSADGGAATGEAGAPQSEAANPTPGNAAPSTTVVARLFLADSAELDAARYSPEAGLRGAAAWKTTVASLEARFPSGSRTNPAPASATKAVAVKPEDEKSSPFYASGWFWGALGAAALIGGAFYFASQDTTAAPIHLQMRVPK